MKTRTETMIDVSEWDKLVSRTYGRAYSFQQQGGCKPRGVFRFSVPGEADDFKNKTVPEIINSDEMGVSFEAWKARDPKYPVGLRGEAWELRLWWKRNFYPDFQTVANDLHAKMLLAAGEYTIDIDW